MSLLKTSLKVFAALLLLMALLYVSLGGASGIVKKLLPAYPQYPEPKSQLSEHEQGKLYFPSATPFDLDVIYAGIAPEQRHTSYGTLHLPAHASAAQPVPLMILMHGSSGLGYGREEVYVEMLLQQGFAAFVLDYYEPRGMTKEMHYMLKIFAVSEFDALSDAYHALKMLQRHPAIKSDAIALSGFSYGGMATRFAMDQRLQDSFLGQGTIEQPVQGFAAFVDVYGPCFQFPQMPRTNGAPLLTLRGDDDASNVLSDCQLRENEIRQAGSAVESHVFAGAGHAWDVTAYPRSDWPESPYVAGCEIRYDGQGKSLLNGQPLVDLPLDSPRETRIVARFNSQLALMDCLQYGYINGQDDATMAKSSTVYMDFLQRHLM